MFCGIHKKCTVQQGSGLRSKKKTQANIAYGKSNAATEAHMVLTSNFIMPAFIQSNNAVLGFFETLITRRTREIKTEKNIDQKEIKQGEIDLYKELYDYIKSNQLDRRQAIAYVAELVKRYY